MPVENESQSFINLGVVVNDKNEVLIVKRVKEEKSNDGLAVLSWAFPGGKQRFDETRKQGVEREVLAETGYEVCSIKEINLRSHPQFPVVIVYHLCHLVQKNPQQEPSEPWEIQEIKWVKIGELKNYFTTDLDKKVAAELGLTG